MDRDDENARYIVEVYQFWREVHRSNTQMHGDYGKWLLASLQLIHAGALYVIGTSENFQPYLGDGILWYFVVGLVLALLSGLVAWFNWGFGIKFAYVYTNPSVLRDGTIPPPSKTFSNLVIWTYWLSILLGVGSLACIPLGAWAVSRVLS